MRGLVLRPKTPLGLRLRIGFRHRRGLYSALEP
jgi:hypothetical protein